MFVNFGSDFSFLASLTYFYHKQDWTSYPYAFGICLASLFFTFVTQLVAFRLGTARLNKLGLGSETDIQVKGSDGSVSPTTSDTKELNGKDIEKAAASIDGNSTLYGDSSESNPPGAQLLAVAILEFGIVFHSIIIGLTLSLASQDQFNVLFIVSPSRKFFSRCVILRD